VSGVKIAVIMETNYMDKNKNKGLADNQEGEFILNESGTSVSIDPEGEYSEDKYDPNGASENGESNAERSQGK
jgi:hypothetical protein